MVTSEFDSDRASSHGSDAVFYEFDTAKADFSMRGQFLNGRAVPQDNGMTRWEVPLDSGHEPTAVAQKVVTVYLMPRPGSVSIQIHASIAPLAQPRPMHIKVIPGSQQVSKIEREYPGLCRHRRQHAFLDVERRQQEPMSMRRISGTWSAQPRRSAWPCSMAHSRAGCTRRTCR